MSNEPRILLCGEVRVELPGISIDRVLTARSAKLAFTYLVLNRRHPVDRDELVAAVWADSAPRDPHHALRTVLYRLRRALGPSVVTGRRSVGLNLPAGTVIDVEEVEQSLGRSEEALAHGRWRTAMEEARNAVLLSEGGLLGGLTAEWLDARRRDLEVQRATALACIAQASLELGGATLRMGERAARNLIDLEPFRESGHALLIQTLAARGDVAEALRVYESVRVKLREELGTVPNLELRRLHSGLLAGGREPVPRRKRARAARGVALLPVLFGVGGQIDGLDAIIASLPA